MSEAPSKTEFQTRLEVLEEAEARARKALALASRRTTEAVRNEANARTRLAQVLAQVEAVEKQIAAIEESAVIEAPEPMSSPEPARAQRATAQRPQFIYLSSGDKERAASHLQMLSKRISHNTQVAGK